MRDNFAFRVLGAERLNVRRLEHLMNGAMSFPEQNLCVADLFLGKTAARLIRVPDDHLIQRNAALVAGPAPEVLIREEQNLGAARQRPVQNHWCVGRGADNTTAITTEGFEVGR